MNQAATFTLADRVSQTLDGLCRAVAARIAPGIAGWAMQAVMIRLVWIRVRRAEQRITVLLARFRAGKLPVVRRTGERGAAVASPTRLLPRGSTAKLPRGSTAKLPRGFAWLLPMVPSEAACFAGQLRVMLGEAEMVGLLAASAQARRVLAPVCRMLGIDAELLQPPPPLPLPVARGVSVHPEGGGEILPPNFAGPHIEHHRIWWDGD